MADSEMLEHVMNNEMRDRVIEIVRDVYDRQAQVCDSADEIIELVEAALTQQPPVTSHAVIAAALYDFGGHLTSRTEQLIASASDDASPMVSALTEFFEKRGIDDTGDIPIASWVELIQQQEAEPYGYLRENDGAIQISIGSERPADRSGGYATPWAAIYARPPKPAAQPQVLKVGIMGKAHDLPTTCRAYTYSEQPDNLAAWKLGKVIQKCNADRSGDLIDAGLSLLKHLEEKGFGVYELSAAKEEGK